MELHGSYKIGFWTTFWFQHGRPNQLTKQLVPYYGFSFISWHVSWKKCGIQAGRRTHLFYTHHPNLAKYCLIEIIWAKWIVVLAEPSSTCQDWEKSFWHNEKSEQTYLQLQSELYLCLTEILHHVPQQCCKVISPLTWSNLHPRLKAQSRKVVCNFNRQPERLSAKHA